MICHYSHISLYPSPPNSYYASHMVSLTNSIIMNRQPELFVTPADETSVLNAAIVRIKVVLAEHKQPSATELPAHIRNFATAVGALEPPCIPNTVENAYRHGIEVQFKSLSSTLGGFATTKRHDRSRYKMRIVIHDKLDDQSRYAVLCHELAHILLGHLGTDDDRWWPCRLDLSRSAVEIEAESVAFMVAARLGLKTASTAYLATYAADGKIPDSVSLDLVTRVTGKVYEMGDIIRSAPRKRQSKPRKSGQ